MYSHKRLKRRSLKSTLKRVLLSWFQDVPTKKRSRIRRGESLRRQRPGNEASKKLWMGCCCTFIFIMIIKYLVGRSATSAISVLKKEVNDSGNLSVDNAVSSEKVVAEENIMPNPQKSNPSDWDLAFVTTPEINLKAWCKSFENWFFIEKVTNEITFWAKFYFSGKFVFMETLKETRRTYTKSDKKISVNFGVKENDYMHAEFSYDLSTSSFLISINSDFNMEFAEDVNSMAQSQTGDDNSWCNYDFEDNVRYHIGCKVIPVKDKLKHTFDSFEFEFVVVQ